MANNACSSKNTNPYKRRPKDTSAWIPNILLKYNGLHLGSKVVWGRLLQFTEDDAICYPSIKDIAVEIQVSCRSVITYIKELEDRKFIRKIPSAKGEGKKTNSYHFLRHSIFVNISGREGDIFDPCKIFWGVFLPNSLLGYPYLKLTSKVIWGRLAQYFGKDGRCYPAVGTLATEIHVSRRTVIASIKELEEQGFIKKAFASNQENRRTNSYFLLDHPVLHASFVKSGEKTAPQDEETAAKPVKKSHRDCEKTAPKEIQIRNPDKKTTTVDRKSGGCGFSFSDEQKEFIDLKVRQMEAQGRIKVSPRSLRAGLKRRARDGVLYLDELPELRKWDQQRLEFVEHQVAAMEQKQDEMLLRQIKAAAKEQWQQQHRDTVEIFNEIKTHLAAQIGRGEISPALEFVLKGLNQFVQSSFRDNPENEIHSKPILKAVIDAVEDGSVSLTREKGLVLVGDYDKPKVRIWCGRKMSGVARGVECVFLDRAMDDKEKYHAEIRKTVEESGKTPLEWMEDIRAKGKGPEAQWGGLFGLFLPVAARCLCEVYPEAKEIDLDA